MHGPDKHERLAAAEEGNVRRSLDKVRTAKRRLRGGFPRIPDDLLHDALIDAIVEWHISNCRTGPIPASTLYRNAWRNAANAVRSAHRQACRENGWWASHPYEKGQACGSGQAVEELVDAVESMLPDPEMQAVFRLWLVGERASQPFAEVLGLSGSPCEQRKSVKRAKDRLSKHLRRHRGIQGIARSWLERYG